jgi:hypothetical protein
MFVDGQSKTAQDCIPLAHFSTVPQIRAIPRAGADITMVHFTSWTSTLVGKPRIVWIRENLHSYMVLIIHAIPPCTRKTIDMEDPNILNLDRKKETIFGKLNNSHMVKLMDTC